MKPDLGSDFLGLKHHGHERAECSPQVWNDKPSCPVVSEILQERQSPARGSDLHSSSLDASAAPVHTLTGRLLFQEGLCRKGELTVIDGLFHFLLTWR